MLEELKKDSDTGIESDSDLLSSTVGSVHMIDWTFTARLREGNYAISSIASEPADLRLGDVAAIDFIPISVRFSVGRGEHLPIYAAAYWENELHVQEVKHID